jgi:hypothetical protein
MRSGDSAASHDLIQMMCLEPSPSRTERAWEGTAGPNDSADSPVNEAYLTIFKHRTPQLSDGAHLMGLDKQYAP